MAQEIQNQNEQFKLNAQAALIYYVEEILQKYRETFKSERGLSQLLFEGVADTSAATSGREYFPYENFVTIRHDQFFPFPASVSGESPVQPIDYSAKGSFSVNSLDMNPKIQEIFDIFPASLSQHVTVQVKIYKTFLINGLEYDWEVPTLINPNIDITTGKPFINDKTQKEEDNATQQAVKIIKAQKLYAGVGLTSFSFDYKGTNTADTDVNLEAQLELIITEPNALLTKINPFVGEYASRWLAKPPESSQTTFCYSDLLTNAPNSSEKKRFNNLDYRIKVLINYNINEPALRAEYDNFVKNSANSNIPIASVDTFIEIFKSFKKVLYLVPHNHEMIIENINFIKVRINYIASINSILNSDKADILNITTAKSTLKGLQDQLDEQRKEIEKQKQLILGEKIEGNTEEAKQKRLEQFEKDSPLVKDLEDIKNKILLAQAEVYSSVLNKILFDNKNKMNGIRGLYSVELPSPSLGMSLQPKPMTLPPTAAGGGGAIGQQQQQQNKVTTTNVANPLVQKQIISFNRIGFGEYRKKLEEGGGSLINLRGNLIGGTGVRTAQGSVLNPVGVQAANGQEINSAVQTATNREVSADTINVSGNQKISFIFLGDILDVLLEGLKAGDKSSNPPQSRPRIVLGDIKLKIPKESITLTSDEPREININLADIPISLDLFMKFWRGIIENKPSSITLHTFMQLLLDRLLRPVLAPQYFDMPTEFSNNKLKIGTKHLTVPFMQDYGGLVDFITRRKKSSDLFFGTISQSDFSNRLKTALTNNISNGVGDYFILYDATSAPGEIFNNNGTKDLDVKKGIFHIALRQYSSIVKKITFSRIDSPGTKEAIASQEGQTTNLITLKQLYQCEITTVPALTFLKPGDTIFIDPYLYMSGRNFDLASRLGVVGYFQVMTSKFSYNKSDILTKSTIKCKQIAWIDESGKVASPMGK